MYNFYFITGSQHLYGEETLRQVSEQTRIMVEKLNASSHIPCRLILKDTVKTQSEITKAIEEANHDQDCAGIMTFMHTFSPSKMWIEGLTRLSKPYCHLHTQFGREIPFESIDMDFMNLNQSAHGDREHGFIGARLRKPRKIVVGYWEDEEVQLKIAHFMRVAIGYMESRKLRVVRFGDNMRNVAVTEGDKVEAQIKLGWSVNTHPVGDLVDVINSVTDAQTHTQYEEYLSKYSLKTDNIAAVKYQAKIQAGMEMFLKQGGFGAFTTTFEDLHGLEQLPGLACQDLMAKGYGFGGEGDWKTSAMTAIMKSMTKDLSGGTSFMEDYTYHLQKGNELILGAHMLEVCPSIAQDKPAIEVHELSIGDRNPPARLTFEGRSGNAVCVSLVDMGGRMRMIAADVQAVPPIRKMPNLPVAGVMWKPLPNLAVSAEAWLVAGGAHHTVMSYSLTAEHIRDFSEMMGLECIHIGEHTNVTELKKELLWNDVAYQLKLL